jgi:hypothetical protein
MEISLTQALELAEAGSIGETCAAPIKPLDTLAVYKLVFEKEATQEWGRDVEVNTHGQYLAEPIELLPGPIVLEFHSAANKGVGQKEPGAGLIDERSIILQKWEGVVLERDEQSFTARLYEGFRDFPVKRAEIGLEEVADEDRGFVVPGASFSWMIGYRIRGGTRFRFSEIYFRRLPPWTKAELEEAAKAAAKLREDAGWV